MNHNELRAWATAPWHGTAHSGYKGHGCRCSECSAAMAAYKAARRIAFGGQGCIPRPFDEIPHGVSGFQNHGCHCLICTKANTDYHRQYMAEHPEQREKANRRARERRAEKKRAA